MKIIFSKKKQFGKEEKSNILNNPETIKRLDKIAKSRSLVQAKAKRINQSAKH